MRGITLSLMVVLAMSGVALGQVTLDYVVKDYYPGDGLKTFTVQATGEGINVLSDFTITGDVHQVFTAAGVISEWSNNSNGNTPGLITDSYVTFGDERLGDLPNTAGGPYGPTVTAETITGGGVEGLGTLSNDAGATNDAYYLQGEPAAGVQTLDLLQLVVPDGKSVNVALTLMTATYDAGTGWFTDITPYVFEDGELGSLDVQCVLDGDANEDGIVDLLDLDILGTGYNTIGGMVFQTGDFNGDGNADLLDLDIMGTNYNQSADWYVAEASEGTAIVPEPGTIMMLVLGSLCLLGYRLRK